VVALGNLEAATQAETLAAALQMASADGLGGETATRAAQDLAAMMRAAKLEEGLLAGELPSDLLADARDGLTREELEKLLGSLQFNKSRLTNSVARLAKLKLIDPALLSQCQGAGSTNHCEGLAAFLKECSQNGQCDSFIAATLSYCRGGTSRGRGDAPMTWTDGSSEEGAKFKEEALSPSDRLSDAEFVGVSRAAPQLSDESVQVENGALAGAQSGGGAAHAQVILPRHRSAVQRFFKRDEF
jgi:hypothetical protein